MKRSARAALLAIAATAVAGCGTAEVNTASVERQVANAVQEELGQHATVSCPSNVPARKGEQTTCTLHTAEGTTGAALVTQTDGSGHVTVQLNSLSQGSGVTVVNKKQP